MSDDETPDADGLVRDAYFEALMELVPDDMMPGIDFKTDEDLHAQLVRRGAILPPWGRGRRPRA